MITLRVKPYCSFCPRFVPIAHQELSSSVALQKYNSIVECQSKEQCEMLFDYLLNLAKSGKLFNDYRNRSDNKCSE